MKALTFDTPWFLYRNSICGHRNAMRRARWRGDAKEYERHRRCVFSYIKIQRAWNVLDSKEQLELMGYYVE
jgi:hypothetical protein